MLHVNKYIFVEICDKDFEKYNDIISTIKKEYLQFTDDLNNSKSCSEIREISHKLIGVVSVVKGCNSEVTYILKCLLDVPKSNTDLFIYKYYIDALMNVNCDNMF